MNDLIRSYIGLGSNLGDSIITVRKAVVQLADAKDIRLLRCSSLYKTEPIGMTDQPDFINAVCCIDTSLSAEALLKKLTAIEYQSGRIRSGPRWGPRTLDLDLLLYGETTMNTESLTLPHPRMHERAFVLYPLSEIAPNLAVPGYGNVTSLLSELGDQGINRIDVQAV